MYVSELLDAAIRSDLAMVHPGQSPVRTFVWHVPRSVIFSYLVDHIPDFHVIGVAMAIVERVLQSVFAVLIKWSDVSSLF